MEAWARFTHEVGEFHFPIFVLMLSGIRGLLAVMGIDCLSKLSKKNLMFKDHTGKTYMDVDKYFEESLIG